MELTPELVLAVLAAMALGALVQGAVGFAFSIISTPIMVKLGDVPLEVAIAASAVAVVVQSATGLRTARGEVPWRSALRMFVPRLLLMPVGIVLMKLCVQPYRTVTEQVIGRGVLLAVALAATARPRHRPETTAGVWAAGSASGFLNGLVGMGGPPMVLWLDARDWSPKRKKAFLWSSFALAGPPQLAYLFYAFPRSAPWGALVGLGATPAVLALSALGIKLGDKLPRAQFRKATLGVLAALAAWLILGPLLAPRAPITPATSPTSTATAPAPATR